MNYETIEAFWARTLDQITILDDTMAKMVIDRPRCKCNIPASIALCKISGDYFWICSVQKCSYVIFLQSRPDPNEVDFGLITPFGKAEIDRYTNLAHIMKWFGACFTLKWLLQVRESAKTEWEESAGEKPASFPVGSFQFGPRSTSFAWYYKLRDYVCCCGFDKRGRKFSKSSTPQEKIDRTPPDRMTVMTNATARSTLIGDSVKAQEPLEYDIFISYRGATGRMAIFFSLCSSFNFYPCLLFVILVCPVFVAIMTVFKDPCYNGWPRFMMGDLNCPVEENGERGFGKSWLAFQSVANWVLLIMLLFWQIMVGWSSTFRVFLDKYCWTKI